MILRFAEPWALAAAPLVLALLFFVDRRRRRRSPRLRFSSVAMIGAARPPRRRHARFLPTVFRFAAIALLFVALARPQAGARSVRVSTAGVDILLALDVSTSMLAIDFEPNNRLDAAKLVAADFIGGREHDRMGLVAFASISFVQCPLTLDHEILLELLDEIRIGMVEDGTAIGMAVVNCVNRLKESEAKSKVAILLTDGVNNTGRIDPATAATLAETLGIRIYAIGIGQEGEALYPITDPVFGRRLVRQKTEIDEETLRTIASRTGGRYFRATDTNALRRIFQEIGEMEKTEVTSETFTNYTDLYGWFLGPGALLLLAEAVLTCTIWRRFP
jgi:Ca-activated chloride channel family protein